jgi:transposase
LVTVEGLSKAAAARRLGRSREWAHKWLRRHESLGREGLQDRSRAPVRRPTEVDDATVARILAERQRLEQHPYASVGGLTILAGLERGGFAPLPSVRTIERVLARYEVTRPRRPRRGGAPKNRLPLPDVSGRPGVWQQADWIQDRYLIGGIVFNSLQVSDVGSHVMTAQQYPRRYVRNAVAHLVERAWPTMSVPQAMGTDNAFVKTSHLNNPWTAWTKTCLYHGVEVIVTPPGGLGWTNHIEAVNNLWQDRTIRRHHYPDLDALRTGSDEACDWFNHHRAIHSPTITGTRYPATLVAAHRHQLRWSPLTTIDDLYDQGRFTLPLTTGRITYIRVVDNRAINVTNATWHVPRPDGTVVTATITTADHTLTITHQGQPITRYRYPIHHRVTDPHYPPADHSLLAHL